jgi:hypothetical protein
LATVLAVEEEDLQQLSPPDEHAHAIVDVVKVI